MKECKKYSCWAYYKNETLCGGCPNDTNKLIVRTVSEAMKLLEDGKQLIIGTMVYDKPKHSKHTIAYAEGSPEKPYSCNMTINHFLDSIAEGELRRYVGDGDD